MTMEDATTINYICGKSNGWLLSVKLKLMPLWAREIDCKFTLDWSLAKESDFFHISITTIWSRIYGELN